MSRDPWQLSASNAGRCMGCSGWAALTYLERKRIKDRSSIWADNGTAAHKIIEADLLGKKKPPKKAAKLLAKTEAKERHMRSINFAIGRVNKLIKKHGGKWYAERAYKIFPQYDFTGTGDFTLINIKKGLIYGWDYKHGQGVAVASDENWQGVSYLTAAMQSIDNIKDRKAITKLRFEIVQPRCTEVQPVQVTKYTPHELSELTSRLREGIATTHKLVTMAKEHSKSDDVRSVIAGNLERGGHCQFCSAKPVCPKWQKTARTVVDKMAKYKADKHLTGSQKELEQLLIDSRGVESYLKEVRKLVQAGIAKGKGSGLLKEIDGSMRRYPRNDFDKRVRQLLEDDDITAEQAELVLPRSPAALGVIEATLDPEQVKPLLETKRLAPTLVPATDKRQSRKEKAKQRYGKERQKK